MALPLVMAFDSRTSYFKADKDPERRGIQISERKCLTVQFLNHTTSAGTLNHNRRVELKLETWINWNRIFRLTVQTSPNNLCSLTFFITFLGEKGISWLARTHKELAKA